MGLIYKSIIKRCWKKNELILSFQEVLNFIFTRVRLDQNMEYYICAGAVQSLYFSLEKFKIVYTVLLRKYLFSTLQPLLLLYQHGKCSDEIYSLTPPVQTTFTAKSQHATSTELKHLHFLSVPNVNSAQIALPQDLSFCGTVSCVSAFTIIIILTSSIHQSLCIIFSQISHLSLPF